MRKAWEWITANSALRKALKRGVSPTTLSKLLMFSHECLLTSCFRSRSCHQGGFFFLLTNLSAAAISRSSYSTSLWGVCFTSQHSSVWFCSAGPESHPPLCEFMLGLSCTLLPAGAWLTGCSIMTTPLITRSPTTKHWEILIWTPLKGAAVMQMSVRRVCQWKTPLIVFDACFYLGFTFCLPLLSLGMLRADYTSFGLAITWRTPPHQPLITNPHYRCQIHGGIFNPTHGSSSSSETLQQQHVNHLARYHTSC